MLFLNLDITRAVPLWYFNSRTGSLVISITDWDFRVWTLVSVIELASYLEEVGEILGICTYVKK